MLGQVVLDRIEDRQSFHRVFFNHQFCDWSCKSAGPADSHLFHNGSRRSPRRADVVVCDMLAIHVGLHGGVFVMAYLRLARRAYLFNWLGRAGSAK
jgi:hypothetical protein